MSSGPVDPKSVGWNLRESARAKIRVIVRRILNKHGYPPELREEAVKLVLEQAAIISAELSG
jgi:type I restriction enzyme R subunit